MAETIKDKKIEAILHKNLDVDRSAWSIHYNKKADMILMGGKYPECSFYHTVGDQGLLIRTDTDDNLYGFAIEHATFFVREHPDFLIPLSFVIHPILARVILLPALFIVYHTRNSVDVMKKTYSTMDAYLRSQQCTC